MLKASHDRRPIPCVPISPTHTAEVKSYDRDKASLIWRLQLPGLGSAGSIGGAPPGHGDVPQVSPSFTHAGDHLSLRSVTADQAHIAAESRLRSGRLRDKQVFYTSQDGTRSPIFISHKGLKLDGNHPTFCTAMAASTFRSRPSKTNRLSNGGKASSGWPAPAGNPCGDNYSVL